MNLRAPLPRSRPWDCWEMMKLQKLVDWAWGAVSHRTGTGYFSSSFPASTMNPLKPAAGLILTKVRMTDAEP